MVFILSLLSYGLGSVSFALIAGKLLKGIDLRDFGSGNVGATNAGRVLGRKAGIGVFLLDVAKGFVPAFFLAQLVDADPASFVRPGLVFGIAAILGHSFPFYLKFKGGKAVATSAGVMLALAGWEALVALLVWIVCVKTTRMISLASIAGALVFPVAFFCLHLETAFGADLDVMLAGILLSLLILYRHKANVVRIFSGTEPRVGK